MTITISKRPRKTRRPALRRRTLGQPNATNVVPTSFLKPELERIITKIEGESGADPSDNRPGGGLSILASRLAAGNGHNPERYYRRIYDWRHELTNSVPADTVDRIYQTVGELYTDTHVPLAEVPSGKQAATEMVEVWCEGEDWNESEKRELASKLLHFAFGLCLGWDLIDMEICNGLELMFGEKG
jgi:hypothetical protein